MELPKDKKVIKTRHNKVVYDCGDTVVKVFNATKPHADVFNEALNLARADQAGIDVPELVEVSKVDGSWALVTKKVAGKTMRELADEDPSKLDGIMKDFVRLQLDVHQHRNDLLNRQKDKYTRMINSVSEVLDESTRYDLLMRLDGMPNHQKICHGDFVPSNVIVCEDGSACICDWAHASQGDGSADCAVSYLHFKLNGQDDFAETYLKTYCELQGTTVEYVSQWFPIVAAAELARGRVVEKDFLLSWISVGDYE